MADEAAYELSGAFVDAVEHSTVPLGTPLEDGTVLPRARAISERGDLRVDRVVGISDAGISVGPVSAVNRGSGALPDFAALTQTVLDRLAPGFAN